VYQQPSNILKHLKSSCGHPKLHTAVILATPSFTHLLDKDNDFLAKAVHELAFGGASRTTTGSAPASFNIRTRSAIVDRLPLDTGLNLRPQNSSRGNEGISVLALGEELRSLRAEHIVPGPSSPNAHVRFVFQHFDRGRRVIALPVANTMFRNGRESTSYEDIWQVGTALKNGTYFQRKSRAPLKSFEVAVSPADAWPFIGIPMLPLTRPCEIGSSIGNVLRELKRSDTGKLFPASTDLEVAVPQFLNSPWLTETAKNGFSVFALITCKDFYATASEEVRTGVRPPGRRALLDGLVDGRARLHRVTGGGGGWGNKKGLLSLEPGVDVFADNHDLLPPLPPEGGNYDFRSASALTSTGDNVQFVAVFPGQQGPVEVEQLWNAFLEKETGMINSWQTRYGTSYPRVVLGTSPPDEENSSAATNSLSPGKKFIFAANHFGMLSEGGACLGRINANTLHPDDGNEPVSFTSRLDVPFTALLADASLRGLGKAAKLAYYNAAKGSVSKSLGRKRYRPPVEQSEEQGSEPSTHKA
jgi:hypothetical protein